jgi:hypothetical protein
MMKVFSVLIALFCAVHSPAQNRFRLTDASKIVNVEIDVGTCTEGSSGRCGPLKVTFFRKKASSPFQTVRLAHTDMWGPVPTANVTNRYDDQSVINFGDFNFDGIEDVAICDGTDGGYGMPSYRVYLYSKPAKRFIYSRLLTRMNMGGLGMFEIDRKKKMLFVFTKDSCCWHQTQGFDIHRGRPRKIYELIEDGTNIDKGLEITTGKLINGNWRTWVKHVKK